LAPLPLQRATLPIWISPPVATTGICTRTRWRTSSAVPLLVCHRLELTAFTAMVAYADAYSVAAVVERSELAPPVPVHAPPTASGAESVPHPLAVVRLNVVEHNTWSLIRMTCVLAAVCRMYALSVYCWPGTAGMLHWMPCRMADTLVFHVRDLVPCHGSDVVMVGPDGLAAVIHSGVVPTV
jgi:hypothetical protein